MSMASTTANWHWKTKHVSGWAKEWFTAELSGLSTTQGDDTVTIEKVTEVEGDVELGQRKSKLITIYDCRVEVAWSATGANDTSARGTVVVPEVSHENTLDGVSDYTYEYNTTSSDGDSAQVAALVRQVRSLLPSLLEKKFKEFPKALVDTHGKDLTVVTGEETPSGSGTVTPARQPAPAKTTISGSKLANSSTDTASKAKAPKASTQTQKVSSHFQASASDLWGMLTDERRMPIWSQAPAQSNPTEGGSWSLLGGAVVGTYVSLEPHRKIIQQWKMAKAPGWPSDHWARLEINLNQGSDSTELEMTMTNVPQGKEDDVQQGLDNYYIRGFKSIGYVQVIPSASSAPSIYTSKPSSPSMKDSGIEWKGYAALAVAGLILALSMIPAFVGDRPPSKP